MIRFYALVSLVLIGVVGCSSSGADVSGSVTYEGEAIGEGFITFTPSDGIGKESASPIQAGRYSLTGVTPGKKVVKIVAVKKVSFASSSGEMMKKAAEAQKVGKHDGLVDPADTIPADAVGNNAAVELKAGTNQQDFNLKRPAPRK